MAYTVPQQRKKEESERLRGERDQIKFIRKEFKILDILSDYWLLLSEFSSYIPTDLEFHILSSCFSGLL